MNKTRIVLIGVGSVLGCIVLSLGLYLAGVYGGGTVQRKTADFRGKTSQIEKTRGNGDYRIAAYNEFFDLCGAVQTQEDRIQIFTAKVARLEKSGDANALADAQTDLDAVTAERAQLIREYNEKATRADTEGHFRASNLPYQIDITKEHTECAS